MNQEKTELLSRLNNEFEVLTNVSDKLFEQRFSTSKFEDSWMDEVFKDYQTARIRIQLLL